MRRAGSALLRPRSSDSRRGRSRKASATCFAFLAARASRPNRPGCRPASASRRRGRASRCCASASSAIARGRTRWSTSGWRRKMPVAEQGASSRIASTGAGGRHVITSAATIFGGEAGARQILAKVAPDDFPRRRPRSRRQPAAASCIVLPPGAAHRSSTAAPLARAEQPRRQRGGDVLHPPAALGIAGQVGDRGAARRARRWPGSRLIALDAGGGGSAAKARSSGGGAAIEPARGLDHRLAPGARASARATAAGRVGGSGSVAPSRITVPNTPWTSLRGPPSTSGSTVEIAACGGVPMRQRLDQRDAQREARLGVVGQAASSVARSISASRSGRRRSASAAMAWAKARSSAASRSRAAPSSAASSGSPLRSTASSRRSAARRPSRSWRAVDGQRQRGQPDRKPMHSTPKSARSPSAPPWRSDGWTKPR